MYNTVQKLPLPTLSAASKDSGHNQSLINNENAPINLTPSNNSRKTASDDTVDKVARKLETLAKTTIADNPPPAANPIKIRRRVCVKRDKLFHSRSAACEVKSKRELSYDDLLHHAKMRIAVFAKIAACYYQIALRTDPEKQRNVHLSIGRANFQVGRGSGGYHASHDNAGAGIYDNIREENILELTSEETMTPKKRKFLSLKGFTEDDFTEMEDSNYDPETIHAVFDRKWPLRRNSGSSIFDGSEGLFVINSTTELPARVNLICDKRLEEGLRKTMVDLYTLLAYGEITPEEATRFFESMVKNHLKGTQEEVKTRIASLEKYCVLLDSLLHGPEGDDSALMEITHNLINARLETVQPLKHGVARPWMQTNDNFLSKIETLKQDGDSIAAIKKYACMKAPELTREVSHELKKYKEVLFHNSIEEEGTKLPEFTSLFGSHDERMKKRAAADYPYLQTKRQMLELTADN